MQRLERFLDRDLDSITGRAEVDDMPIPVAEDWDSVLGQAERMAGVIDRHLEFESKLQGRELRPATLCPEQRSALISDLAALHRFDDRTL